MGAFIFITIPYIDIRTSNLLFFYLYFKKKKRRGTCSHCPRCAKQPNLIKYFGSFQGRRKLQRPMKKPCIDCVTFIICVIETKQCFLAVRFHIIWIFLFLQGRKTKKEEERKENPQKWKRCDVGGVGGGLEVGVNTTREDYIWVVVTAAADVTADFRSAIVIVMALVTGFKSTTKYCVKKTTFSDHDDDGVFF